jgi:hypothetical protein
VNAIPVNQGASAAAPGGEPVREHRDDGIELVTCERSVRPCPPDELEQLPFRVLATCRFGDDLLSQNVK